MKMERDPRHNYPFFFASVDQYIRKYVGDWSMEFRFPFLLSFSIENRSFISFKEGRTSQKGSTLNTCSAFESGTGTKTNFLYGVNDIVFTASSVRKVVSIPGKTK